MNPTDFLTTLAYIYLGQIVAFTICQLLFLRSNNRVHIYLWLIANGFNALAIFGTPFMLTAGVGSALLGSGTIFSLIGALFRFLALGFRTKSIVRDPLISSMVIFTIVGLVLNFIPSFSEYRSLITSISGVAISIACLLVAKKNRYWSTHNEFGRSMVLIGMAVSAIGLMARTSSSYPFGEDEFFLGTSPSQILALAALVGMSLILQIGFTGMLVARQDKMSKFLDRRNVRVWQRNLLVGQRTQNLRKAADDRLDFMELLTHEVRQPINNAQASLQSITPELDQLSPESKRAIHALDRAKSSLDDITLALSNAIVSGTLTTGETQWLRQTVEVPDILDMALLDCSASSRQRITVKPPEDVIFFECVPILVRIALHNLFQYALGSAETDSSITISVVVDDENFGVVFMITGKMDKEKSIAPISGPDITMNDSEPSQMKSLGFFVADLIAKHHLGECNIIEDGSENFKIKFFVPQVL